MDLLSFIMMEVPIGSRSPPKPQPLNPSRSLDCELYPLVCDPHHHFAPSVLCIAIDNSNLKKNKGE